MRIFSKRSFQFDHPAGEQPAVTVRTQDFADVPDWVEDSLMFKLANKDGDVSVIGGKQDEKDAETGAKTKAEKAAEKAAAKAAEEAAKAAEEEAARLLEEQLKAQS